MFVSFYENSTLCADVIFCRMGVRRVLCPHAIQKNAEAVAEMACARAARDAVEARIDILKAQINRGNLSNEEFYRLSTEMTELRRMLNES